MTDRATPRSFGTIRARGSRFQAICRAGGVRRSRAFASRIEAEAWLAREGHLPFASTRPIRRGDLSEKERAKDSMLRWKFGITLEVYDEMLALQGGACAGCGGSDPGRSGVDYFSVDHDHACCPGRRSCGKCIRLLLCFRCNTSLGHLGDSPQTLRRLADALEAPPIWRHSLATQ